MSRQNESPKVVRNILAQIYGIKPEEVTWKQIQFEMSGLLSTYPHIELIPSVPKQELPSASEAKFNEQPEEVAPSGSSVDEEPIPPPPVKEITAAQIQRLREECRWSVEKLAEAVDLDLRTVTRHLSGSTTPHLRNISAYERVFSKQLKRQIVINKMP